MAEDFALSPRLASICPAAVPSNADERCGSTPRRSSSFWLNTDERRLGSLSRVVHNTHTPSVVLFQKATRSIAPALPGRGEDRGAGTRTGDDGEIWALVQFMQYGMTRPGMISVHVKEP